MARNVKTLRTKNALTAARRPLAKCLHDAKSAEVSTFSEAEPTFLEAMHAFDAVVAAGNATSGDIEWMLETKAVGVPKHPGNTAQEHKEGRAASADIDKRIKEATFKTIDIKGEVARKAGKGGGATSDLTSWLRSTNPLSCLSIAARVRDDGDRSKCELQAQRARTMLDAVGLYCYGWNSTKTAYEGKALTDNTLELDRVIGSMATSLRHKSS